MSESSAEAMAPAFTTALIAPGARVGKYEIVQRLACGGMAEIYLARASGIHGFEKYIVLKRILPQYGSNEDFIRMFLKEARVAASLDHANIAQVHDIGESGGSTFFTMEYLHGEDLRQVMRHVNRTGQRLPLEHALEIVIGAASGLHFAHDKRGSDGRPLGIVHRDISPSNIVVTYQGGVKVVDFGIAKLAADPELSQRHVLKGKIAYVSPEQLQNQPLDRRTDVFSLGVVLYEITTHKRLFKGRCEAETIKAVFDGVVPPPTIVVPGYPPALERIVLRALARAPENRYQSARDLQVDLETFVHDERLRLSPAGLAEWMGQTFGSKQEIWHTLSAAAAATDADSPPPARERTAATKVTRNAYVSEDEQRGAHSEPAARERTAATKVTRNAYVSEEEHARREPVSPPAAGRIVGSSPPRIAILAGLALLVVGGAIWFARGGFAAASRNEATVPLVVVAEQGQIAVEHGAVAAGAPPVVAPMAAAPSPRTALSNEGAGAAPAAGAPRRARRAPLGSGAPRGGSFSATFARREGDIRRCFLDHPGGPSTELSLRFDVERDGHVVSVAVQPATLASGPLGMCLAAVGKSTVFQKQAAPVSFRIPLTIETAKSQP